MAGSLDKTHVVNAGHAYARHVLALLAVLAMAAAVGFWVWQAKTKQAYLELGVGADYRFRDGLVDALCDEALPRDLQIHIQPSGQSVDAIQRVDRRELDAAIIPAGMAVAAQNVRQVTMLDCETLHLFVKPELCQQGLAALRGRCINLGVADSGVRIAGGELLRFIGLKPGQDYRDDSRPYTELLHLTPDAMPDAIFVLAPMPTPLGDRLASHFGYQLMALPLGDAMSVRKPCFEDVSVPAAVYGGDPPVPSTAIHTVGNRALLIAHRDVPPEAIQRLLEVLYESDFARRAGLRPLDSSLAQRLSEYPIHAGSSAYLHRFDPWINQKLLSSLQGLGGTLVSVASAILLAWQWYRRRRGDVSDYLRGCNRLDLDAHRAACRGEFGDRELGDSLAELARLKTNVLERHSKNLLDGDRDFLDLVTRIEGLQQTLPSLVRTAKPFERIALAFPPDHRKSA